MGRKISLCYQQRYLCDRIVKFPKGTLLHEAELQDIKRKVGEKFNLDPNLIIAQDWLKRKENENYLNSKQLKGGIKNVN